MKASRPTKVITNASAPQSAGWMGILRRQANNILTALLVVAAIAMLIRWRIQSSANAKIAIANELSTAQLQVQQLAGSLRSTAPAADLQKTINQHQNAANQAISSVLNSSDADGKLRAQALIARGDMYWDLANIPTAQGVQLSESSSAYLQKAWEAYQEVLKNSTYADQHESLSIAHLGLAAIAENRAASGSNPADWATAKQEFEAVANDPNALEVLAVAAKNQLAMIPDLQTTKYYLAPVVETPPALPATTQATTQASTMPTVLLPMGPPMPAHLPTTLPKVPGTMPTLTTGRSHMTPTTAPAKK
jgi:hypothetical protein